MVLPAALTRGGKLAWLLNRAPRRRRRSTGPMPGPSVIAVRAYDDRTGHFVRPTVAEADNPDDEIFNHGILRADPGNLCLPGRRRGELGRIVQRVRPLGSILAPDRTSVAWDQHVLRFAAGNFYINDKPTGAGSASNRSGGGRASGTTTRPGRRRTSAVGSPSAQGDLRRRDPFLPAREVRPWTPPNQPRPGRW
jgi:hypothetical protein